jgi:hypothetical protein
VSESLNRLCEVKALTLHQPWASLIAEGVKRYETRAWTTRYRGPIAIHAGLRTVPGVGHGLPHGCIVAIADLVDVLPSDQVTADVVQRCVGDLAPGRYAWVLDDVRKLDLPIHCGGAQGLWQVAPAVASLLHDQTR